MPKAILVAPTLPKRLQGLARSSRGFNCAPNEPRLCGLYPDRWLWARQLELISNEPPYLLRGAPAFAGSDFKQLD